MRGRIKRKVAISSGGGWRGESHGRGSKDGGEQSAGAFHGDGEIRRRSSDLSRFGEGGNDEEDRGGEFRARRWKLTWERKKWKLGVLNCYIIQRLWSAFYFKWFNEIEFWFKIRAFAWFSSYLILRRPFTSYLVDPVGFTWRFAIHIVIVLLKLI